MEDAKDGAALYHASVIREVTNEEEKAGVIKNERVDKDNDEKHEEEG
jgi:hypothetical protein